MKTLASITLEFLRRFDEKKREKNILDFNDLEHLCLKILIDKDENNNIIPSKVADYFREFLMKYQLMNIKTLIVFKKL